MLSDEILDNEGISDISNTLRVFGNNGSTFNDQINDGNTIQINGLTSFATAQVLDALEAASDHLPVVQDFQLPAVLEASLASVPETVVQGEQVAIDLTISNAADVQVFFGADELDFSFATTGAVQGSGSGVDNALGGSVLESVLLDTSTIGEQTGLITVSTSSFAAANALIEIPVTFEVVAATLEGDFNGDSLINAADFVVFRDGGSPNPNSLADFDLFVSNFGSSTDSGLALAAAVVPEPSSLGLLLLGLITHSFVANFATKRRAVC